MLYTTLLSPYFFTLQLIRKRTTGIRWFAAFLLIYDAIHLFQGVQTTSFLISNGLFIATYFTVVSAYHFINGYEGLPKLFRQILVFNACLTVVALPFYFMEPALQDWMWWVNRSAPGATEYPRLKLFTYEASYYSLLFVPVAYYYLFKLLFRQVQQSHLITLLFTLVPLILSMSFGVIGASLLSAMCLLLYFRKQLFRFRRAMTITFGVSAALLITTLLMMWLFPGSPIVIRIFNVLKGMDTSANGRISDSLSIAWRISELKSIWFGAGLGQVKVQIVELIRQYYNYWGHFARYDIPNTIGETLAIFGISGVLVRLGLELYFFRKTKVWTNYYRLALFIFVFVYQFTGSFITNIAEYTIWILAFSDIFPQFNTLAKRQ